MCFSSFVGLSNAQSKRDNFVWVYNLKHTKQMKKYKQQLCNVSNKMNWFVNNVFPAKSFKCCNTRSISPINYLNISLFSYVSYLPGHLECNAKISTEVKVFLPGIKIWPVYNLCKDVRRFEQGWIAIFGDLFLGSLS